MYTFSKVRLLIFFSFLCFFFKCFIIDLTYNNNFDQICYHILFLFLFNFIFGENLLAQLVSSELLKEISSNFSFYTVV